MVLGGLEDIANERNLTKALQKIRALPTDARSKKHILAEKIQDILGNDFEIALSRPDLFRLVEGPLAPGEALLVARRKIYDDLLGQEENSRLRG